MGYLSRMKKKAKKAAAAAKKKVESVPIAFKKTVDKSVEKNFGTAAKVKLQNKGASAAKDFKKGKVISGTLKTVSVGASVTGAGSAVAVKKSAKAVSKVTSVVAGPFKKQLIVAGVVLALVGFVAIKLR